MASTDPKMGRLIQQHLVDLGIETPFKEREGEARPDKEKLKSLFTQVMQEIGIDLSDDSMSETPTRLAKLYGEEFFGGLNYNNFPKGTVIDNKMNVDEMVIERNIQLQSLCEHHWLPIVGVVHIAYIPGKKVLGLSKFHRIVGFFGRRPQVQERLTLQIHAALAYLLDTQDIAVRIEAEHLCVKTRGVEDPCSDTVTTKLSGKFSNIDTRMEFTLAISKK